MLTPLVLLALLCSPVRAGSLVDQPDTVPGSKHESMSVSDARVNFGGVVETHLKAAAPRGGPFPYRDEASGKTRLLTYDRTDEGSVRELAADKFSACVFFKDVHEKPVDLDFTVDFSGERWAVTAVGPHAEPAPVKAPPRPKKAGQGAKKAAAR